MRSERYTYQDGGANTGELGPKPERSLLAERGRLEINPDILMNANNSNTAGILSSNGEIPETKGN